MLSYAKYYGGMKLGIGCGLCGSVDGPKMRGYSLYIIEDEVRVRFKKVIQFFSKFYFICLNLFIIFLKIDRSIGFRLMLRL